MTQAPDWPKMAESKDKLWKWQVRQVNPSCSHAKLVQSLTQRRRVTKEKAIKPWRLSGFALESESSSDLS